MKSIMFRTKLIVEKLKLTLEKYLMSVRWGEMFNIIDFTDIKTSNESKKIIDSKIISPIIEERKQFTNKMVNSMKEKMKENFSNMFWKNTKISKNIERLVANAQLNIKGENDSIDTKSCTIEFY